jgi:hypothetical protein
MSINQTLKNRSRNEEQTKPRPVEAGDTLREMNSTAAKQDAVDRGLLRSQIHEAGKLFPSCVPC